MGLELVIFIGAILFGIFLYWRESNGNGLYRLINKIVNSKALQMDATNKKGFVYKQAFLPRLVFVASLFLIVALILQFLTPFKIFGSYNGFSAFSSVVVGTLVGTYLANFVIKSSKVIEKKSETIGDMVEGAVEKGKDLIDDLNSKDIEVVEESIDEVNSTDEVEEKSARERLKDKGLL